MLSLLDLTGRHRGLILGLFGLAVLLYAALLCSNAATRKPWNDEAMSADAGFNLAFKGNDGVAFYDDQHFGLLGTDKHSYYIFPFQLCILALWYHVVPFTLFSTRVLSMLWTGAMLFGLYHTIRKLVGDSAVAFLAVALTAFDYQIMTAASFGRYDTMVAALGLCGYGAFLALHERSLKWAILVSNAMVAAAGATHPNGIIYFAGLWFLILYYDRRRIAWRELGAAALPYAIGGAIWAAYIFQDFGSFRAQLTENSAGRIGLLHPWQELVLEFQRRIIPVYGLGAHSAGHDSPIVRLKVVGLIALVFGLVVCALTPAIRRNRKYAPFFYLTGIHWFLVTFSETTKFVYYLVHLLPLLSGVLAIALAYLWRTRGLPRLVLAGGVAALVLVNTGGILAKVRLNDYGEAYLPAVQFVKEHAQPGDEIFTVCSFGFGYGFDKKIVDDESLGYYSGKRPPYIVMEEIFDDRYNLMKTYTPEKYRHVTDMLGSYKLVYHNSEYRVYERPDLLASAAPIPN
jgi:hypothetical protein